MKICLRRCAAGSEGQLFARIQFRRPNNIAPRHSRRRRDVRRNAHPWALT